MTVSSQHCGRLSAACEIWHTLVDKLEFRDDVKANFGELVLEHLQEHGEQVIDSPR